MDLGPCHNYAQTVPHVATAGVILHTHVYLFTDDLATGWTVRGSKPEIFCALPDRPWGPPSLLHYGYRVIPGGKTAGTLTTHTHQSPRLKIEYRYTSTPPLGLRELFNGDFYLYLYLLLMIF